VGSCGHSPISLSATCSGWSCCRFAPNGSMRSNYSLSETPLKDTSGSRHRHLCIRTGRVRRHDRLGRLIHEYERVA
jgi:hypothetical protein